MEYIYFSILAGVLVFAVHLVLDCYLVKTGKIVDQVTYAESDIREIKKRGFLYYGAAFKRLDKVPELQGQGYKVKQQFFSDL